MTLPDHHARLYTATSSDGILTLIERFLRAGVVILATSRADHLARTAGTLRDAADAIESARKLARLGIPRPGPGNTVTLDPMDSP